MRPYQKIYLNLHEFRQISVVQNGLLTPKCKILFITALLVVFFTTIIVPIVVSTNSTNESPSTSKITNNPVLTTTEIPSGTTSCPNSTTFHIEPSTVTQSETSTITFTATDLLSIIDSSLSATISTVAMIGETKEFFTETIDNTTPMQSTREITSTTTTTTTMTPPNLLINPGAENQFEGWTQMGPSTAIIDSNGKFHRNYYPRSGSNCFAGGRGEGPHSKLHQRIDLVGGIQGFTEEQLDSGNLTVYVSFYYQTWRDELIGNDYPKVDVSIRTDSLEILNGIHTGELHCTPNPGWCHYKNSVRLPFGARTIFYVMLFYERVHLGLSIDAYIDDNSLIIM